MTEGVTLATQDGVIVYSNPAEDRMFGYEPGELIGSHVSVQNAYPDDENARVVGEVMAELNRSSAWRGEWLNRRKDGVTFITTSRISSVIVDGRPHWLCVQEDITEQKEAARALRESQARLELVAEAAELGVWDWEVTTGKMTYSPRARAICGFSPDQDITYEDARRATHPDDYPRTSQMALRALDPLVRAREPYEYRIVKPDGEVRWVIAAGEAVFDDHTVAKRAVRYVGTIQDITERRAAEARLSLSEESLRLATEAAEVGIWDLDLRANVLTWSDRTKAAFGISPGRPCSMDDFYAGLHPDDIAATTEAFASALDPARRATYDVEYRTIGKEDGRLRWVSAKGRGFFNEDGECVRAIGTAIDITGRKRFEGRLLAGEAALRALNANLEQEIAARTGERNVLATVFETTDAFIQVADLDYRYIAINKACANEFERIFGVRPKVGDSILDILAAHPESQAEVKAVWSRALGGEEFTIIEAFGQRDLDSPYYEIKFNALRDESGVQIGAYQFVYDVTERLRNQAQLAAAQKALRQSQKLESMGQLTGGVAHDFNNLLTPIIGSLDMLQRRGGLDERMNRLVDGALQSAERAKTLVQRLLAFARRQPLQPVPVDVTDLIAGMAELIGSTLGPQIKVAVDLPSGQLAARADPNQLELAILNLAVNARDAMPEGGTISICAAAEAIGPGHPSGLEPGDYVRISVADNGVGMDEVTLARAIEPFFSTKGVGKGTGLGLSMVHGLASQLGGSLTIASRPGRGTNIDLWLPVSLDNVQAAKAEAGTNQATAPALRGVVLLVDDENLVRASTAELLKELGYEVIEAASAEACLQVINSGASFDILVTDHLMPGMTGVHLAQAVREIKPGAPVLIISGYAEAEGVPPDLPRLTKPFRRADLALSLSAAAPGGATRLATENRP